MAAPELNNILYVGNPEGNITNFQDTTGVYSDVNTGGYGPPNTGYGDIDAIRLKIASYPNQVNTQTLKSGNVMKQYTEYIKTVGSPSVYDGKTLSVGNIIIPQISGITVQAGDEFETTGYVNPYVPPSLFLPADNNPILYLSIANLGQEGETISDTIYTAEYEVYAFGSNPPFAAVNGTTYLVIAPGVALYNGNQYRAGEQFIATDTTNITSFSGNPVVSPINASVSKDFILTFNMESAMCGLVLRSNGDVCNCKEEINAEIMWMRILIEALRFQAYTGTISYGPAYSIIESIQNNIVRLQNGSC